MKTVFAVVVAVAMVRCASTGDAAELQDLAEGPLIEGQWTYFGPRTVLGQGTDTTVLIQRAEGRWTITFRRVLYPSLKSPDRRPYVKTEGPFPITAEKGILTIKKEKKQVRYTFKISKGRLTMPAIIQPAPGLWLYQSESESLRVRCEHAPRKVPEGTAEVSGMSAILKGKGFYKYEEAPRSRLRPNTQYLRFLGRTKDGRMIESFRFIFDSYGAPRFERILSTGESSRNHYRIVHYLGASKNQEEKGEQSNQGLKVTGESAPQLPR